MLDPLYVSLTSALGSAIAVGITLARRRNHLVEGMRAELDLALEENKRLVAERAARDDELHAAKVKASDTLQRIATDAVAATEQSHRHLPGRLKKRAALTFAQKLDAGDNGQRDFSDAELSIAIEAAVNRAAAAATR